MIFCIHDFDPKLKKKGAFEIQKTEIKKYNNIGYGIHHTANLYNGTRQNKNIKKINYWLADLDDGNKVQMLDNIFNLPLLPSVVVETKRGYHCYWRALDADKDNYRKIEEGIISKLNADKACKDPCRLLRYPNTYHLKNPKEPFKITILLQNDKAYTEKKMLCAFERQEAFLKPKINNFNKKDFTDPAKWERIFKIADIGDGNRNAKLVQYLFWLKDEGLTNDEIAYVISGLNNAISEPLEEDELFTILRSKNII